MIDIAPVNEILQRLSVRADRYELKVVAATLPDPEHVQVTVQFFRYSPDGHIDNILEQGLRFHPALAQDLDRLAALVEGWSRAARELFTSGADLAELFPHELLDFEVLELKRATTADDFYTAALAKKRLGRWFPA